MFDIGGWLPPRRVQRALAAHNSACRIDFRHRPLPGVMRRETIQNLLSISAFSQGTFLMAQYRRLTISDVGDVTVVRFVDRKILDELNIQELGQELFQLVEEDKKTRLLLNFQQVEFLSSAALGKLITLDKKVKAHGGKMKFSNIRPEIYEVFAITKLNKLFDIKDDEADALAAF
jgi:anti-sigma B factor antagonist